jgi:hypothetical protein
MVPFVCCNMLFSVTEHFNQYNLKELETGSLFRAPLEFCVLKYGKITFIC